MWRFVLQYLDVMAESFIMVLDCHSFSMLTKDNVLEISLLLHCQRTRPNNFQRILCLPLHSFLPYTDQFMSLFNLCRFFLWLQFSYLSKRYCQSRINHYQPVVYPQWWNCSLETLLKGQNCSLFRLYTHICMRLDHMAKFPRYRENCSSRLFLQNSVQ